MYLKAFRVSDRELLQHGDGLILQRLSELLAQSQRVSAAVILAMDGTVGSDGELDEAGTEIYIPNRFVADATGRYSNLLYGASINPYRRDAVRQLEQASYDGAVLIKWLPSIQLIDPSDERLTPFYIRMKELDLPLLSHTGNESSFTLSRNELADPERLRLPLSLGVKVIAAHAGSNGRNDGESNHTRFIRLCREFDNLSADISALTQLNRLTHLPRLLKYRESHHRLLYGSDMPLLNTCIISPFAFPFRLPPWRMLRIARIANPWDRDVALKEALGVTGEMLQTGNRILRLSL
jgi:uncharacterized protein